MGTCVKVCTTTSLGDPAKYPGRIWGFEGKLYWSDGEHWLEISQLVTQKIIDFPDSGTDTVSFIAEDNFIINSATLAYPTSYSIMVNDNDYDIGNLINYGDTVVVYVSGGDNQITLELEKVYIDTLNLKPRINPNFDFSVTAGSDIFFVVGVTNVSDVPTTSPFQFYINKLEPVADIDTSDGIGSVSGLNTSYITENASFTVLEQATRWRFTSNVGVVLQPKQTIWVGGSLTNTLAGSANLSVQVVSGTGGGETPTSDNILTQQITVS